MFHLYNICLLVLLINFFFIYDVFSKDLISYDQGGKVVHWTSEDSENKAINLIDTDQNSYWSTSDISFPQVITYAFPENKRFEAIIIKGKNDSEQNSWAHEVRVSTADPFPHMGGWIEIRRVFLPENGFEKIISFDGMRGRYFRIEIFSNHGSQKSISLGSFKVLDKHQK